LLGLTNHPSRETGDLAKKLGLLALLEAKPLSEHLELFLEHAVRERLKPGHQGSFL